MVSFPDDPLLQVLLSVVAGGVVTYFFYRRQQKELGSAEDERYHRAREELLDILEGHVINDEAVTEDEIWTLVEASSRRYRVDLGRSRAPVTLLRDVSFRLQQSRHLGAARKAKFAHEIQDLIRKIEAAHQLIPEASKEPLVVVDRIEDLLVDGKIDDAQETLKALRVALQNSPPPTRPGPHSTERLTKFASVMAGTSTALLTLFVTMMDGLSGTRSTTGPGTLVFAVFAVVLIGILLFLVEARAGRGPSPDRGNQDASTHPADTVGQD